MTEHPTQSYWHSIRDDSETQPLTLETLEKFYEDYKAQTDAHTGHGTVDYPHIITGPAEQRGNGMCQVCGQWLSRDPQTGTWVPGRVQ